MAAQKPAAGAQNPADAFAPQFEEAATRVRDLNEKLIEAAKQNGNVSLDVYEKTLADMLQYSQKTADSTEVEFISSITKAHADYINSVTKIFTGIARDALK
ncbi:hypothetical protein [Brevibacterium litoralis]|uniref:hypothetical protein n=1 Tax=Brevibacterium litoralis TaxID=3138935 RepID=UPI0032F03FBA